MSDTDHSLLVAKDGQRLSVSKQAKQKLHMERFNLKKLNNVEGKNNIKLKSHIGLWLRKSWMIM
jgi:hypothetical protein